MKFICPKCQKDKIEAKAWVQLNNNKIIDFSLSETGGSQEYWCPVCEIHILPVKVKKLKINERTNRKSNSLY